MATGAFSEQLREASLLPRTAPSMINGRRLRWRYFEAFEMLEEDVSRPPCIAIVRATRFDAWVLSDASSAKEDVAVIIGS